MIVQDWDSGGDGFVLHRVSVIRFLRPDGTLKCTCLVAARRVEGEPQCVTIHRPGLRIAHPAILQVLAKYVSRKLDPVSDPRVVSWADAEVPEGPQEPRFYPLRWVSMMMPDGISNIRDWRDVDDPEFMEWQSFIDSIVLVAPGYRIL